MSAHLHWDVPESARASVAALTDEHVRRAVEEALTVGERPTLEVSVVFVSDDALTALHGRFLDDPTPTDVITFDLEGDDEGGPGGELYVSVDAAHRCAPEHDWPVENELLLYVVHGTLHLCGFDDHDEEDRKAMRRAEARVFGRLGVSIDVTRHERQ